MKKVKLLINAGGRQLGVVTLDLRIKVQINKFTCLNHSYKELCLLMKWIYIVKTCVRIIGIKATIIKKGAKGNKGANLQNRWD